MRTRSRTASTAATVTSTSTPRHRRHRPRATEPAGGVGPRVRDEPEIGGGDPAHAGTSGRRPGRTAASAAGLRARARRRPAPSSGRRVRDVGVGKVPPVQRPHVECVREPGHGADRREDEQRTRNAPPRARAASRVAGARRRPPSRAQRARPRARRRPISIRERAEIASTAAATASWTTPGREALGRTAATTNGTPTITVK